MNNFGHCVHFLESVVIYGTIWRRPIRDPHTTVTSAQQRSKNNLTPLRFILKPLDIMKSMVLDGIGWCWMVLDDIGWYWMALRNGNRRNIINVTGTWNILKLWCFCKLEELEKADNGKSSKWKGRAPENVWEPSNDLFVDFRERSMSSRNDDVAILVFLPRNCYFPTA